MDHDLSPADALLLSQHASIRLQQRGILSWYLALLVAESARQSRTANLRRREKRALGGYGWWPAG